MQQTRKKVDPLVGGEIDGRFSVNRILGEGGMGKVYAGHQLSVGREVAIKVLRSELADDDIIVQRFFREAKVISQFSHPNTVNLIDFGHDVENGVLYLAMEFIDGIELGDIVQRYRMTPQLAVDIVIQTCEGLSEPHSQGVIHRDLKPENIMLIPRSDGRLQAKVVDFGIAHALQDDTRLTQTGSVFGTVHYMAPEQASSEPVGPHTDVYALGCILFELLTGATPFSGENPMEILMAHTVEDPPVLSHVHPGGSSIEDLSLLILEMMQKHGSNRPATVLEVRDRLEAIRLEHRLTPIRVTETGPPDRMLAPWILERLNVRAALSSNTDLIRAQTDLQTAPRQTEDSIAHQPTAVTPAVKLATRLRVDTEVDTDQANSRSPKVAIGVVLCVIAALLAIIAVVALTGDDTSDAAAEVELGTTSLAEESPEAQEPSEPELAAESESGVNRIAEDVDEAQKIEPELPEELTNEELPAANQPAQEQPPARTETQRDRADTTTTESQPARATGQSTQARENSRPTSTAKPEDPPQAEQTEPTLNIFGLD